MGTGISMDSVEFLEYLEKKRINEKKLLHGKNYCFLCEYPKYDPYPYSHSCRNAPLYDWARQNNIPFKQIQDQRSRHNNLNNKR